MNSPPVLSLVLPCFNEEDAIRAVATELATSFEKAGTSLELVLVDNGSTDRTGAILDELVSAGLPVTKVTVAVNAGYGNGILRGYEASRGAYVGHLCADGQIDPADVLRVFRLVEGRTDAIAKVTRRARVDGWRRIVVSAGYNAVMTACFGRLGTRDINASPKILSRARFLEMRLASMDWFIDPEMLLKAKRMGLAVIEAEVTSGRRKGGVSKVRLSAIVEFVRNIAACRIGLRRL